MAVGLGFDRERSRARLALVFLTSAAASLAACEGDTLIEGGGGEDLIPPDVAVITPENGDEVRAGRQVPVRVVATDGDGVVGVEVRVTGSFGIAFARAYSPPLPQVTIDTVLTVPDNAEGPADVTATATNTQSAVGTSEPVRINVAQVDTIAPHVGVRVVAALSEGTDSAQFIPDTRVRLELTDSFYVHVRGVDNRGGTGLRQMGATVVVVSSTRSDTLAVTRSVDLGEARTDTVEQTIKFPPPFASEDALPDSLSLEFYGWAVDDEGVCAAAIYPDLIHSLRCLDAEFGGQAVTVAVTAPESVPAIVVQGRSKSLEDGGTIADVLVDTLRSRLYLSNLSRNKVNVFVPGSFTWSNDVLVGAEPWGLALNLDGDTLFVGNSGGTSISFVSITGATPREDLNRRLVTRNTPLFSIRKDSAITEAGRRRYDGKFIDFSDRPQFMAQDAEGRLLYSTKPTEAQRNGTLRVVVDEPGWLEPESRILLRPEDVNTQDTATISIANIDSVAIIQQTGQHDLVELFDHRAGYPDSPANLIRTGPLQLEAAISQLVNNPDSDIFWRYGNWDLLAVGLADTTYVDASGDRQWVAFGEGGRTGPSRIILWDSDAARIHSRLLVADLVNNASEAVRGVDLNRDGTLGASRGVVASYFYRTDLRLQGSVSEVTLGGSGTVLHPHHPSYQQGLASSDSTTAFLGTGDSKIKILDTVHFTERGELEIRDVIAGPFRSAPPLPSDNGGLGRNCSGPACVVVKLYGMTDRGQLVVIDVRRRDILPLP